MIVSHKYRYVFVELPRTGSTAVSRELQSLYEGKEILKKHATYSDFLRIASDDEKQYFSFSTVRNPADKILSLYFKYKTDQRGYREPDTYKNNNKLIASLMKFQFNYVQKNRPDFATFFKRYYYFPYDDWSSLDHKTLDYVMNFENLSNDFSAVLNRIGIEPVRPLPIANKTAQRDTDFWTYYTEETHDRAQWVFGPYFKKWGYEFPQDWHRPKLTGNEFTLTVCNLFRHFYWRYVR